MATTTVNLHVAARDLGSRGVRPFGEQLVRACRAVGRSFVQAAERQGSLRAAQELRRIACSFEGSQPDVAADLRTAAARCENGFDARR